MINNSKLNNSYYSEQIRIEKHMYKWCLIKYGSLNHELADKQANDFYNFESEDNEYKYIVFHEEAWHWAMIKIHGENYWIVDPSLKSIPSEYKDEYMKHHKRET